MSLCAQTSFDFEWLVIDDGSTDNTKTFFNSLPISDFPIRYIHKENGGKHRAINMAAKAARGEWFFIVDSDDYLRGDAIETLNRYLKEIENDARFCGVTALRITLDGICIGTPCAYQILDTDYLSYRSKYKIVGDRAEVVRSSIIRSFPFPEIEGEKFCTEAVVWNRIAQKYICRYVNESIYYCDYQEGGLSDTYRQIMRNSPYYSMIYARDKMTFKALTFKEKIIAAIEYLYFLRIARFKLIKEVYPPIIFYFYILFTPPVALYMKIKKK